MLFQTPSFAIFFLVVYAGHLALKNTPLRHYWLLLASYVFYAFWHPLYVPLLAWITVSNFAAVWLMEKTGRRRLWFWLSVVNSVGILGFFKYAGFVTENLNAVLGRLGASYSLPAPSWVLPVGISFYTFQAMSYTIDYYRGKVDREPSLVRFAAFVALFPRLMMGPIERASNLLPQLRRGTSIAMQDVGDGLSLFIVGLFKKVALADYLAAYVNKVYAAPDGFRAPALLLAAFAYSWQIYFDFSGYTDMARGVARVMGFRLMLNFNNPYLADSLGDFWRRWHISLSAWFRDYVYIPLGGNRKGSVRTYVNMALTMVISGLWHGAAWTFVIWGALHAAGRVVTRGLEGTKLYREKVPRFAKQMLVFAFVTFAWVFFRASTFGEGVLIIRRIFTTGWDDPAFPLMALAMVAAVWAYQFACESRLRRLMALALVRLGMVLAMALYLALFAGGQSQGFIYLQF